MPRLAPRWILHVGALLLGLLLGYETLYLVQVWQLREHDPRQTAFMSQSIAGRPATAIRQQWRPYGHFAPALKRAIIAAEDATFLEHVGFDWDGIRRAFARNWAAGQIVAGGSTISQQVAKNLFLSTRRTLARKAQEAAITLMLEGLLDKRRILEIYINVSQWGDGLFGAEAAARHYFGVSAAQLEPREASLLAAMLPRPTFYFRNGITPALEERAARIREHMPHARVP